MVDRPIIFSAPMVRALLGGRKTQTRRVMTRHTTTVLGERWGRKSPWEGLRFAEAEVRSRNPLLGCRDPHLGVPFCHPEDEPEVTEDCGVYRVRPVIKAGDRLWVREAFSGPHEYEVEKWPPGAWFTGDPIWYWADGNPGDGDWTRPRPSIHMPRWASRLTLLVTDVRVQRLQEISEADAVAEGPARLSTGRYDCGADEEGPITSRSAITAFGNIWNSIHGDSAWLANPWVAAISFDVIRANIDAPPEAPPASVETQTEGGRP